MQEFNSNYDNHGLKSHTPILRKNNWNDRINLLAQPKRKDQPKYVSTAEQVTKFYSTPTRFHTWQKKLDISVKQAVVPNSRGIPESPMLATKLRCRSNKLLSRDEIEKQEMEKFKKYRVYIFLIYLLHFRFLGLR